MNDVPLFPLHTVLFPGGYLPMRIFETRYLEMVKRCALEESGFVVVLIRHGKEVGEIPLIHPIGTFAHIVDFNPLPDGLLGITVQGDERMTIQNLSSQADNLLTGEVVCRREGSDAPLPEAFAAAASFLDRADPDAQGQPFPRKIDLRSTAQVAWRLAERLPVDNQVKQALLEEDEPLRRLALIGRILEAVAPDASLEKE